MALASAKAEQFVPNTLGKVWGKESEGKEDSGIPEEKTSDGRIQKALKLMQANMEQPLSSPELAERAHLSVRQLERLFKQYFDQTPARYYTYLRLCAARQQLKNSRLNGKGSHNGHASVTEVALAHGFISLSHFCKLYRQHFGMTPGDDKYEV